MEVSGEERRSLLNQGDDEYISYTPGDSSGEHNPTATINNKGFGVFTCAMFIIAEMAGSGILALPKAISGAGWTGLGLLVFCCLLSLYCGIILSNCWTTVREADAEYNQGHVRDPYPLIGQVAAGRFGKCLVEICVLLTLFGVCIVFLLLASEQISNILNTKIGSLTKHNEFRIWILICGVVLLPFTWLATPKDMWPFALAASGCTLLATVFIIVRTGIELQQYGIKPSSSYENVTPKSFFSAFGTIAFSFGGAALFPTFQTDMKEPKKFPKSAFLAFVSVLSLYVPVVLLPYLAFGSEIDDNILTTLSAAKGHGHVFVIVANVLITFHLLFTFVITINPIGQQIEEYFKLPHEFGWKRVILRTCLVLLIIAISEAVPNFGPILSLIGGSAVTMMAFVLPCWFYLKLNSNVQLYVKVLHYEIILVALVCGGAAMYSAGTNFKNPFKAES